MPLTKFICPDEESIPIQSCLQKCRMPFRCATLPFLLEVSKERVWQGIASTTQLLNGTMYEFLRLTKPYSATPESRAFALHGTHSHNTLEQSAKELGLPSEIPLNVDRDIFDLLQPNGDSTFDLIDNKTWGSYKVAKALGLVFDKMVPDPSGELYKRDSPNGRAGEPKMVRSFRVDISKADMWEAELQLNRYRVMASDLLGLSIRDMWLFIIVRDGGLEVAYNRGITRNIYNIKVKRLEDDYVTGYFSDKDYRLMKCMKDMKPPSEPCDEQECWQGSRCREYCEVWYHCPKGLLLRK